MTIVSRLATDSTKSISNFAQCVAFNSALSHLINYHCGAKKPDNQWHILCVSTEPVLWSSCIDHASWRFEYLWYYSETWRSKQQLFIMFIITKVKVYIYCCNRTWIELYTMVIWHGNGYTFPRPMKSSSRCWLRIYLVWPSTHFHFFGLKAWPR